MRNCKAPVEAGSLVVQVFLVTQPWEVHVSSLTIKINMAVQMLLLDASKQTGSQYEISRTLRLPEAAL